MNNFLGLLLAIGLILLNAFFVAAEFSLVSVRRSRIAELVESGNAAAPSCRKPFNIWIVLSLPRNWASPSPAWASAGSANPPSAT